MIMIRFFLLLQLYHWTTFYKQKPWQFLFGVILAPYHFIVRMFHPPDIHAELAIQAIGIIKGYWQIPGTLPDPPEFVRRKFLRFESELKALQ